MTLGKLRGQRGAGGIGCLLVIALVAGGVYAGFQYAMPKLRYNSFSDRLNESLWNFKRQSAEDIQRQVILMATEFDIALTPEQVKVATTTNNMSIDVSYEKVVDLKFKQITLPFRLHRDVNY
jgi:hypothetical protein